MSQAEIHQIESRSLTATSRPAKLADRCLITPSLGLPIHHTSAGLVRREHQRLGYDHIWSSASMENNDLGNVIRGERIASADRDVSEMLDAADLVGATYA